MYTNHVRAASGYALIAAAAACILGGVLHPVKHGEAHSAEALTSPGEALGTGALLAGTTLLLLGLPAVYGWLMPRLRVWGLVGVVMYLLGNLLSAIPHLVVMTFIGPEVARRAPDLISQNDFIIDSNAFAAEQAISGLVFVAGLIVLGLALVRERSLPRWIGAVAIAGGVLALTPLPTAAVVSGLQFELARGVVVAALGVLAIRSTKSNSAAATTQVPIPVGGLVGS